MARIPWLLTALFAGWLHGTLSAFPLPVTNPGFEANSNLTNPQTGQKDNFIYAAGQGVTAGNVPGWTFTTGANPDNSTAYGGVSDLATPNHAIEGSLDNNIAWLFIRPTNTFGSISASQQLAGSMLENNTLYTLTLRVAQAKREEGIATPDENKNPVFPTLGDGVSTGDVFARLRVGSLATAMPGFLPASSTVLSVADDQWVDWTLRWQTGAAEPLAGQPLFVQLFHQGTRPSGGPAAEVFFDDVSITAVPEPATASAILVGTALMALRRWRR